MKAIAIKAGKIRKSYPLSAMRQKAKAIFYHYYDKDLKGCNVRIEEDGISLTVGNTKFRGFRTPSMFPFKYKETIKQIDRIIEIFQRRNQTREKIEQVFEPMWAEMRRRGKGIQH